MRRREILTGLVFMLPILVGLTVFFFPMMAQVVRYSFSDIEVAIGERYSLIPRGWDHFNHAFRVHPTFVRELTTMITDMLWNVPLIIFLAYLWQYC